MLSLSTVWSQSSKLFKCANCNGQHMAGAPECPVKISYRREKRATNQQQSSSYLSSPARLYSTVLPSMAPHVHADATTCKMTSDRPTAQNNQSSLIINALKEEIGRSQDVLLNCITQLEEKCDAVHGQQATLRWTIETQMIPFMSTMSDLLVDVCEQLDKAKVIALTNEQQKKSIVFDTHQQQLKRHFIPHFTHLVYQMLIRGWSVNSRLLHRSTIYSLVYTVDD
jgi:hypothetical protein